MTTKELLSQAVSALSQASTLVDSGVKMAEEKRATEEKLSTLIPSAVELLVQSKNIRPDERTKAANVLADHAKAIGIIQQMAKAAADKANSPDPIGAPVGVKSASDHRSDLRDSDAMLFERFNVPVE